MSIRVNIIMLGSQSIKVTFLVLVSLAGGLGQFTNEVVPPTSGKIKEYTFTIQHRLGMVLYNDERETGTPVIINSEGAFKRNGTSTVLQECDKTERLTDEEKKKVITGDGSYKKLFTINRRIPGPSIVVNEGTQVVVKVENRLIQEAVTLHWHGMVQQKTPYMDGVGSVSQCPITPGETFTYRFMAYPAGTHWYHSHLGTTRSDGLFGALIVLPTEETTSGEFDKEFIMTVQDWTREDSKDVVNEVYWELERYNPGYGDVKKCYYQSKQFDGTEVGPSPSVSLLCERKGFGFLTGRNLHYSTFYWSPFPLTGFHFLLVHLSTYSIPLFIGPSFHLQYFTFYWSIIPLTGFHFPRNADFLPISVYNLTSPQVFAENPNVPLERFIVKPQGNYRFRVIGTAMLYAIKISIDQHNLVVISTDGNDVKERRVSQLIINTGERYDFSLDTFGDIGNYWIRLETLETSDVRMPSVAGTYSPTLGFAVLHYEGADDKFPNSSPTPCTKSKICTVMNCPYRYLGEEIYKCIHVTNLTGDPILLRRFPVPEIGKDGDLYEQFINFHFSGTVAQRSSVNGHQMVLPSAPPQIYPSYDPLTKCPTNCRQHCVCTYIVDLPLGRVVQMTLLNMGVGAGITGTAHPVHLHGHHFYVLKTGFPTYDENGTYLRDNEDIMCANTEMGINRCNIVRWNDATWKGDTVPGLSTKPVIKDTVIVPVGGYVVLRFKADNPGYWFAHCHIEIHQVEGMSFIMKEGKDSEMPPLPEGFPTCGNFDWSAEDFDKAINAGSSTGRFTRTWFAFFVFPLLTFCWTFLI
ncbi:uncharacterized protein LOC135476969 [Liolophura sinensis]|uniref:uncharacterized protein LOC135476969 n=1 Tax=Liolophura sinensis TaxID=3198878 RepID=UPI003158B9E1